MLKFCCAFLLLALASCQRTNYYIVRHAEKQSATMTVDLPLSDAGRQRAEALKEVLNGKVGAILSTNTQRTRGTAQPLADASGIAILPYDHRDTALLHRYRDGRASVLFVGHSNTVDDLVNYFMGRPVLTDLPDSAYGDLFIVTKKGKEFSLRKEHFGR